MPEYGQWAISELIADPRPTPEQTLEQCELRELVTKLGLTAVYVTHDQEEAFALCDRISVMNEGRVLQTGAPRALYEYPELTRVARFLGRNNLIVARRLTSSDEPVGKFRQLSRAGKNRPSLLQFFVRD